MPSCRSRGASWRALWCGCKQSLRCAGKEPSFRFLTNTRCSVALSGGELFQKVSNIPFAATTPGKCAGPSGNRIHIEPLFEKCLDIATPGAAAMAHDVIGWERFIVHG